MNEVSKCAEMNCPSFENLHFPLEDVDIEIWVLKGTVWKLLLSSMLHGRKIPNLNALEQPTESLSIPSKFSPHSFIHADTTCHSSIA